MNQIADTVNALAEFLGVRDVPELSPEALFAYYGFARADALILFGGSIPAGADVAAEAMKRGCAEKLMIVGGEGHTTGSLREKLGARLPGLDAARMPEAELFAAYLKAVHGIDPDLLETESTNCGNNVTNALDVLSRTGIAPHNLILIQDATMQRRMDAGFRKHAEGVALVNFAAYHVRVKAEENRLVYPDAPPWGMWDVERYLKLLMGEIPRLKDDAHGYGPNGKGFIAHVEIPEHVREAFDLLARFDPALIREADARYATRQPER